MRGARCGGVPRDFGEVQGGIRGGFWGSWGDFEEFLGGPGVEFWGPKISLRRFWGSQDMLGRFLGVPAGSLTRSPPRAPT